MQEIRSSNSLVVTGICDPNKSRARRHHILVIPQIETLIFLNLNLKLHIISSVTAIIL